MAGGTTSSSGESKLAPFDHKDSKLSDKQKFDSWLARLRTRLGKVVGRVSSCLFHVPDPLNADKCWGLLQQPTWCFNDDDGAVDKSHENINKWYKAQMHMYELILESFQHSDPQVLNDFNADAVTSPFQLNSLLNFTMRSQNTSSSLIRARKYMFYLIHSCLHILKTASSG